MAVSSSGESVGGHLASTTPLSRSLAEPSRGFSASYKNRQEGVWHETRAKRPALLSRAWVTMGSILHRRSGERREHALAQGSQPRFPSSSHVVHPRTGRRERPPARRAARQERSNAMRLMLVTLLMTLA